MKDKIGWLVNESNKILDIALNGNKNFIFGTGWMGTKLYEAFNSLGVSVDGFIVSKREPEKEFYMNTPVYEKCSLKCQFSESNVFIALRDQSRELTEELNLYFYVTYEISYPNDLAVIAARFYIDKLQQYINIYDDIIQINGVKLINPFFKESDYLLSWVYEAGDLILPIFLQDYSRIDEGVYEEGEVYLEKEDIVLDCGANIGLFSAVAADKGCKVYAFEPIPETIEYLDEVKDLYPQNIEICPFALSDEEGEVVFHVQNNDLIGASMLVNNNVSDRECKVKVTTVDMFVKDNCIERVDYIKADIEGAERNMLIGAKETIKKYKPKISICTYHLEDDKEVLEHIIREIAPEYIVEHKWKKLYAYVKDERS